MFESDDFDQVIYFNLCATFPASGFRIFFLILWKYDNKKNKTKDPSISAKMCINLTVFLNYFMLVMFSNLIAFMFLFHCLQFF